MGKGGKNGEGSIHDGHRKRFAEKILLIGLENLPEHEVLEYELSNFYPRGNVNPLAHKLLDEFGSFAAVHEAGADLLEKFVSPRCAFFITQMPAFLAVFNKSKFGQKPCLNTPGALKEYAKALLQYEQIEKAYIICLNSAGRLICAKLLHEGNVNECEIYTQKLIDVVRRVKPALVALTHNHPSGVAAPSAADDAVTASLYVALKSIECELVDHIVVGGQTAYSYFEAGVIARIKNDCSFKITKGEISDIKY